MNDLFFILAQILAVVAFGLDTLAMQCKKKSGILIMGIASNMTYALEYAFLGAWTGAISLAIGTVRNITYFIFDKKGLKPNIYVLVIFISLLIGAGVYTWENVSSLLPMVGLILWTVVSWQDNTKWMRVAEIMICIMWIVYDIFVGAYAGCLTEFIILSSATIGLFRHDRKKKEEGER